MYTRKQYLNDECDHRDYYGQYVTDAHKRHLTRYISESRIIMSKDEHLNDIPLKEWDNLPIFAGFGQKKLKENGDSLTLSAVVCIYKEAARQIIDHWESKAKLDTGVR
jgi:hypothetical protein